MTKNYMENIGEVKSSQETNENLVRSWNFTQCFTARCAWTDLESEILTPASK